MKWLTSKSVWGAVALGVLGVLSISNGEVDQGVQRLAEALALIGLRHGVWKAQG